VSRRLRVEPTGEPVRWWQYGAWRYGRLAEAPEMRDGSLLVWDDYTGGARCLRPVTVQHETRGPRGGRRWDWIEAPPSVPVPPAPPAWKRLPGRPEMVNQLPLFGGLP
jgi:hypothetical protein